MEIVWQTPANPPEAHDYIFREGKRYVRPYYFEFISHVKNRWVGKTVVDLFSEEFTGRSREYYVSAVKSGRIQVDGQTVSLSYRVRSSQKISHFLHRHEPPVMGQSVSILLEEPDVITVCKPPSVPVHPCGQYRKNTVVGILQAEHGLTPLFPVHRLDRLVSGLLIFARNSSKADQLRQQIEGGLLQKEYIAKIVGIFPEGEQVANANVDYNAREGRSSVETPDQSNGKNLKGKAACTKFTRISSDGIHSIVLCKPVTGRTHQIRVHLQYLGYPIANDELYLSEIIPSRSTKRLRADGVATDTSQSPSALESLHDDCPDVVTNRNCRDEFPIDPMCTNCPNLGPKGYDGDEEGLWLHCVRYSGPGWTYECPFPDWAFLE